MQQEGSSNRPTGPTTWQSPIPYWSAAPCLALLLGMTGCGSPTTDQTSGLESRAGRAGSVPASAARGAEQGEQPFKPSPTAERQPSSTAGTEANLGGDRPATPPNSEPDRRDKLPVPGVPESIAKDLDSSDARARYRALDHWEAKDSKAPLDPVFEAMEDEDPAVRAKATAIVEKHWAAEQEQTGM